MVIPALKGFHWEISSTLSCQGQPLLEPKAHLPFRGGDFFTFVVSLFAETVPWISTVVASM